MDSSDKQLVKSPSLLDSADNDGRSDTDKARQNAAGLPVHDSAQKDRDGDSARLKQVWTQYKKHNLGATQEWLGRETGLGKQGTVSDYMSGRIPMNLKALICFCNVFGVAPETISPSLAKFISISHAPVASKDARAVTPCGAVFNVLDVKAACGNGYEGPDYPEIVSSIVMPVEEARRFLGTTNALKSVQVIAAMGDSMKPTINPTDLLFVNTSIKEFTGDGVYIIRYAHGVICKRLQKRGKSLIVRSDNSMYESYEWDEQDDSVAILGRVIASWPLDIKLHGS